MSSSKVQVRKSRIRQELTEEAVHKAAWGKERCIKCKGPPVINIRFLMTLKELMQNHRRLYNLMGFMAQGKLPTVETKFGQMVVFYTACICAKCRKIAEVDAAHAPSWALVEIVERIPRGWNSKFVQVPRGMTPAVVQP